MTGAIFLKKSKLLICLLISVLVLGAFSGCSLKADSFVYSKKDIIAESSADAFNEKLYVSTLPKEEQTRVSRSDMTALYFDESNYSICIYDNSSKMLWRALPQTVSDERAAVLSVRILSGGKEYILNSQDDSVAAGLASFEIGDNSVCITYNFKKTPDEKTNIDISIPVVFTASDGMMSVEIDCSKLKNSKAGGNAVIKEISLLNYFGASSSGEKNDYLFVPDGCGAIIDTSKNPKKFAPVSIPVYGSDDSESFACIPAFGMKSGEGAFVAMIEEGDALAKVKAEKALAKGGFNRVGAEFTITESVTSEDGKRLYVSKNSYDGKIKLSYRFLSYDTANYVGMASACREMLIRNGVLDMQEQIVSKGTMPFNLILTGAADFAKPGKPGGSSVSALTTFEQTSDILSYLNGKGIGNINLRYRGIFVGALNQRQKLSVSKLVSQGVKAEDLTEFSQNRNVRIFADINLFSAAKDNSFKNAFAADSKPVVSRTSLLESNMISSVPEMNCIAYSQFGKNANNILSEVRDLNFEGVCFGDAGKMIYSDCSKQAQATRQDVKSEIAKQTAAFSSSKEIMVSGGNIYSLKYAGVITDLPNKAGCSGSLCREVPFVQIVLHGYADYSSTPFNLTSDSEESFLKAAEYGEVPCYEWYYSDFSTEEEKDNCSYMNYAVEAQQFYERLNAVFYDLGNKKITAHEQVRDGVYCTKFGSSASVYVNYNSNDVSVNGVVVEGRSILRVN